MIQKQGVPNTTPDIYDIHYLKKNVLVFIKDSTPRPYLPPLSIHPSLPPSLYPSTPRANCSSAKVENRE